MAVAVFTHGSYPAPHRLPVPARLIFLLVAVVTHSVLSEMRYAGLFVTIRVSAQELQCGAELMYYRGDIFEMLLALALVTTWHPVKKRALDTIETMRTLA